MLALAVSLIALLMIVLLKTRSVWLGLIAASFVAGLLLITQASQLQISGLWRKRLTVMMLIIVAGMAGLFWAGRTADPFSFPGRLYSIIDAESPHNIHRINIWKGSAKMFQESPAAGIGPGNWRLEAPQYFDQSFDRPDALNWARPHNDFLWVTTEKGVGGLILYAGIFVLAGFYLFRILRETNEKISRHDKLFAVFMMAGLAGYLLDANFSFPYERIEIQVLLAVMIASAVTLHHRMRGRTSNHSPGKPLLAIMVLLLAFSAIYGRSATNKEVRIQKAIAYSEQQNFIKMLDHAQRSITPFRSLDAMGYPAEYYIGYAHHATGNYRQALAALEQALQQSPYNVWILKKHAQILQDLEQYAQANQSLYEILEVLPNDRSTLHHLANNYFDLGEYQEAYETLTSIDDWESFPNIANNVRVLEEILGNDL